MIQEAVLFEHMQYSSVILSIESGTGRTGWDDWIILFSYIHFDWMLKSLLHIQSVLDRFGSINRIYVWSAQPRLRWVTEIRLVWSLLWMICHEKISSDWTNHVMEKYHRTRQIRNLVSTLSSQMSFGHDMSITWMTRSVWTSTCLSMILPPWPVRIANFTRLHIPDKLDYI